MTNDAVTVNERLSIPADEIRLSFSRSSGPGGQNVNKSNTKVELRFDLLGSNALEGGQKARAANKLRRRLTRDGELVIACDRHRSQEQNRRECLERLADILREALRRKPPRKTTAPTRASRERRLRNKKHRAEKKRLRRGWSEG